MAAVATRDSFVQRQRQLEQQLLQVSGQLEEVKSWIKFLDDTDAENAAKVVDEPAAPPPARRRRAR